MLSVNATDVRKDWGGFIDSVVRDKPKMIKRSRDRIVAISLDILAKLKTWQRNCSYAELEKS